MKNNLLNFRPSPFQYKLNTNKLNLVVNFNILIFLFVFFCLNEFMTQIKINNLLLFITSN